MAALSERVFHGRAGRSLRRLQVRPQAWIVRRVWPSRLAATARLFALASMLFSAAVSTASALTVEAPKSVAQGDPFFVRIIDDAPGEARLRWLGRELAVPLASSGGRAEGTALLGVSALQAPGAQQLGARLAEGGGGWRESSITVQPKRFPEQKLTLPPRMVEPSPDDQARIAREREVVRAALDAVTPGPAPAPLLRPVPGASSSAYGLRRVLNGQPRQPHQGLDFRAALGQPVLAAADGRAILVAEHYFSGVSVYLDHGQGVVSAYFHLSEAIVRQGQAVRRGETIGLSGATGRATGPHLHFGLSVLGQLVDPTTLFEPGAARGDRRG